MRDKFFNWLGRVTYQKYWLVILIFLVITIFFMGVSSQIKMETSWMSMLPQEHESVKTFKRAIDQFGAVTNMIIAVEGPDKESIIKAGEELKPFLEDIYIDYENENGEHSVVDIIKRVELKYEVEYLKNHGLMLEKAKNLEKNKILYTDYNLVPFFTHINDVFETQYVSDADNLSKQEKEAERGLDGIFQFFESFTSFAGGSVDDTEAVQKAVDAITVGDGYYLSSDKKMLLLFLTPTISINEMQPSVDMVDSVEVHLDKFREKYTDISFGITGMQALTYDEMTTGMSDTYRNLIFALILILTIFIVSFRLWTAPILAMTVLIFGIIWDVGIAQLIYGRLNIMTAMCSVILLGLGIDFAVHIISSYTELRHAGQSVENSVALSFKKIGTGLLTGALTTSIAFLAVLITGTTAFMEFGFVIGIGIICCLIISLFLLPSLLVAKEKIWGLVRKDYQPKRIGMEFKFIGKITDYSKKSAWVVTIFAIILTAVFIYYIPDGRMNDNYMDLEAEGLESVRLQKEIVNRFHMSPDNMIAVYDDLETVSEIQNRLNSQPTVGMVESIASVMPSSTKQEKRQPILEEIQAYQNNLPAARNLKINELIEQLYRLSDNITEISSMAYIGGQDRVFDKANQFIGLDEEGNQVGVNYAVELAGYLENNKESAGHLSSFQRLFIPSMKERLLQMSNPEQITLDMVPSSYIDRYVSKDSASFLVAFYSNKDIWDGLYTSPFLETVIRNVPNASGTPVFMKAMVEKAKEDGARAFIYALIAIFILLMVDFKSLKTTLVAMIPLVMSISWLLGMMGLFDINYTVVNVIGFPLLLGIGIDDGVHVIHRYKIEGKLRLAYSMSSIGKAILLTSLTTILGFGSLISSEYRGYIGLGLIVALGIGLCFITSVLILPAIMKIVWGGKKAYPEFFKNIETK